MSNPYRAGSPRAGEAQAGRALVPEAERSPQRAIRARQWSDGTTELRLRPVRGELAAAVWAMLALVLTILAVGIVVEDTAPGHAGGRLLAFAIVALPALFAAWKLLWYLFGSEQLAVTSVAVARRRTWWRRPDVVLLDEVSTVVVSGSDDEVRLDLQLGRKRLALAERLGYTEDELRWLAQRLRRAIDGARATRRQA